jgi:probable rRNA maturation factor
VTVCVSNLQAKEAPDSELESIVETALSDMLKMFGFGEEAEVSLVFVDDLYIQELNKQYRQIDLPTDVLSFAMLEGEPQPEVGGEVLLGDIVISLPTAIRQAAEYGHSLNR